MGIDQNIKDIKYDLDCYIKDEVEKIEGLLRDIEHEAYKNEPDINLIRDKADEALKLI